MEILIPAIYLAVGIFVGSLLARQYYKKNRKLAL